MFLPYICVAYVHKTSPRILWVALLYSWHGASIVCLHSKILHGML